MEVIHPLPSVAMHHVVAERPQSNAVSENMVFLEIRNTLLSFFERSGIATRFSFRGVPDALADSFYALARSYKLGLSEDQLNGYGTVGLVMAATAFRHTPFEVQVAIASYSFQSCIIDDEEVLSPEVLSEFPPRFFHGDKQLHPVLTLWADTLANMPQEHFPPYPANVITTNSVDFVSAEMLVRNEAQGGPDVKAIGYADYIRMRNGLGDTFAAFIWPRKLFPQAKTFVQAFPHAAEYICWFNDLYSFYKEFKAGETDNYVSQFAVIHGQTPLEAFKTIAENVLAMDRRVKDILGDGPERQAWESFTAGYAEFHLHTPRYCLKDLLPEFYSFA